MFSITGVFSSKIRSEIFTAKIDLRTEIEYALQNDLSNPLYTGFTQCTGNNSMKYYIESVKNRIQLLRI